MKTAVSVRFLCLAAAVLVAGCTTYRSDWGDYRSDGSYASPRYTGSGWRSHDHAPRPGNPGHADLALSEDAISAGLREYAAETEMRTQLLKKEVPQAETLELERAAAEVRFLHAMGARDLAADVIAAHPQLYSWEQAESVVFIDSRFRGPGQGSGIDLTLERQPGADGPIAIAFPPGTYGVPVGAPLADRGRWVRPRDEKRYGNWPAVQDLAFLRAPVILLEPGQTRRTVRIPVSCASFHRGAPSDGAFFELTRFEEGSRIDRLMVALCAGEYTPDGRNDAEVQLAVWLSRSDITWDEFRSQGGQYGRLVTFSTRSSVLPRHAEGAARLLLKAGEDPRSMRFFGGDGTPAPQPPELQPEQPEVPDVEPEEVPEPQPEPEAPSEPEQPGDPGASGNLN